MWTSHVPDAIMRGMDLDSRDREDSLDDALKDLDSLMRKAKDMVRRLSPPKGSTDR